MKRLIAVGPLFALVVSVPIAAQDVIQVPAEVPTIQDAVDMAQSGDVVLVDAATYEPPWPWIVVSITGKGISLLVEDGPLSVNLLTVEYVPPGETVLVRGISNLDGSYVGAQIRNNSGRVIIEDSEFRGDSGAHAFCDCPWDDGSDVLPPHPEGDDCSPGCVLTDPTPGHPGVIISNSTSVLLLRCTARGGFGGSSPYGSAPGGVGLSINASRVVAYGSHLNGAWHPSPGAHGASVGPGSEAHFAGCTFVQGAGLWIDPAATVTTRDNVYEGMPGPTGPYVEYPEPHRAFWADSPAAEDEFLDLHFELQAGDLGAVMPSLEAAFTDMPALQGVLLVGDPLLDRPLFLPADGSLLSVRVPPLPGLLQALEVHLQLVTQTAAAELRLGPMSTTTLLRGDLPLLEFACPPDVTVECDEPTEPSHTGEAVASSGCGEVTVTYADELTAPGLITRTWTAGDACGNVMSCQQRITLIDTTAPSLWCPSDVALACGEPTDPSHTGQATVTDNCDDVEVTHADDLATTGVINRTWTASDDAGNTTTCEQVITVDTTAPSLWCPPDVEVDLVHGETLDPSHTGQATATDNCGEVTVTYADTEPVPGLIIRTWTATDAVGHAETCDQTITVHALHWPADVVLQCGEPTSPEFTGVPTGVGCWEGAATSFVDASQADCGGTETITRTWTATGCAGQTETVKQVITTVDTTAPLLVCPPDQILPCGAEPPPPALDLSTFQAQGGQASDLCGEGTLTWLGDTMHWTGVVFRRYRFDDGCGHTVECEQTLLVQACP